MSETTAEAGLAVTLAGPPPLAAGDFRQADVDAALGCDGVPRERCRPRDGSATPRHPARAPPKGRPQRGAPGRYSATPTSWRSTPTNSSGTNTETAPAAWIASQNGPRRRSAKYEASASTGRPTGRRWVASTGSARV